MPPLNVSLTMKHLCNVSNYLLALCLLTCFVTGFDGFVFSSVAVGSHNITVRGTSSDGQTVEKTLNSVMIAEEFILTTTASALGTIITVTMDANQAAAFECKLDDSNFVPCKQSTNN